MLNCEGPEESFPINIGNGDAQDCVESILDEIKSQIKNLKNHKSPGEDEIKQNSLNKEGMKSHSECGNWSVEYGKWRITGRMEDSGDMSNTQERNKQDCNNYRRIDLLNVTYKVLSNCIPLRLKSKAEEILDNYQGEFRPGRSTIDQIIILKQLF